MKLFLICFIVFCPFSSLAKTGYVNLMKAFENTKQGRRVKARLSKKTEKAQKHFKSMENKIQKEEEALKKEVALLSEQARAKKIGQFQQQVFEFQKSAKAKELELQQLQNKLMGPVLEKLKQVTGEVAKKESYQVVENIGNDVIWVAPELDLTTRVYKVFNKKYK